MTDEERARGAPKYYKYAAAAKLVRSLGWAMDSCGDAAIAYPDTQLSLSVLQKALEGTLAAERERIKGQLAKLCRERIVKHAKSSSLESRCRLFEAETIEAAIRPLGNSND